MGRWKMGPQGGYYDANDSGPDQYSPTPAEASTVGGPQTPAPTNQIPVDNQGPIYRPPYGRGDQKMPPFEIFPGQGDGGDLGGPGGGWFTDPAMKNPGTIEAILAKLREMWGGGGAIGGGMHAGNPDHSMPQSMGGVGSGNVGPRMLPQQASPVAQAIQAQRSGVSFDPSKRLPNTGINGGGSLLGGALGGLFGR